MSARGEVRVEVIRPARRASYLSACVPQWLAARAKARGWGFALEEAIRTAEGALRAGDGTRAKRWAAVADALAKAIAYETTDAEIAEAEVCECAGRDYGFCLRCQRVSR